MTGINAIKFISRDKRLAIYKILVLTANSYRKFLAERGSTYLLELFMETCRERKAEFMGLRQEGSYVYALIGIRKYENEKRSVVCGTSGSGRYCPCC